MYSQQIGVILLCITISLHQTLAVINNGKATISSETSDSTNNSSEDKNTSNSVSASNEKSANRRETSANTLSDLYNIPVPNPAYHFPVDSYLPPLRNNLEPPAPVYGVPNTQNHHVPLSLPVLSVPPPLPHVSTFPIRYGTTKPFGPHLKLHQGLPLPIPKLNFHQQSFNHLGGLHGSKPSLLYGSPPLTVYVKPQFNPLPKPIYGPPPKLHKPSYNLPIKLKYVPPKPVFASLKPLHAPPKVNDAYGVPFATYGPPHTFPLFNLPNYAYNPIKDVPKPSSTLIHLPVETINHGGLHPKAPAPPTPPDIKYDGWQPIPGLVSRPYLNTYGVPHQTHQLTSGLDLNIILPPPQVPEKTSNIQNIGNKHHVPSDSYGAPLNSITGSGGIVSETINNHETKHAEGSLGNSFGGLSSNDNSLSVIKSVEYNLNDLSLNEKDSGSLSATIDSYSVPPPDSYSPTGPYPAATRPDLSLPAEGVHLLQFNGAHNIPPSGQNYALTLDNILPLHTDVPNNPLPLNSLDINPPKTPVVFREPVPPGLIESIGETVAYKDALGIPHSNTNLNTQTYVPPPIPDVTKQKYHSGTFIPPPSNLYSLPTARNPTSFQSVVSGTSHVDLTNHFGGSFNFDSTYGGGIGLSSYNAPLAAIDSSHGLPLQAEALTSSFNHNQGVDLSSINFGVSIPTYTVPAISLQSTLPLSHDCPQFGPHTHDLAVGLPSSYAFSSVGSNIGDQSNQQIPLLGYETSNIQTVYPLQNTNSFPTSLASNTLDTHGQIVNQDYLRNSNNHEGTQELHANNGIQNIPIQGAFGSYTLQVQPADDILGQYRSTDSIPHDKILSKDLLQSILSAIEQPQEIQQTQHYADLQHASSDSVLLREEINNTQANINTQNQFDRPQEIVDKSNNHEITTKNSEQDNKQIFNLIDNNEIALYFNVHDKEKPHSGELQESKSETVNENEYKFGESKLRNGQQYGSFQSLRTSNLVNKNVTSSESRQF